MINKLALFINHNIFLTKEQIEKILEKKTIKVIGASVPVWLNASTSKTTEPAKEFFCQYRIYYDSKKDEVIQSNKVYDIFLKKIEWKKPENISLEESLKMTFEERKKHEKKMAIFWKKNPEPPNLNQLQTSGKFNKKILELDVKIENIENHTVDVQHVLNIKKTEELSKSLC